MAILPEGARRASFSRRTDVGIVHFMQKAGGNTEPWTLASRLQRGVSVYECLT
jgi:hypothetical protein